MYLTLNVSVKQNRSLVCFNLYAKFYYREINLFIKNIVYLYTNQTKIEAQNDLRYLEMSAIYCDLYYCEHTFYTMETSLCVKHSLM